MSVFLTAFNLVIFHYYLKSCFGATINTACVEFDNCVPDGKELCGIDDSGIPVLFLDKCELLQHNCKMQTFYQKTSDSRCTVLRSVNDLRSYVKNEVPDFRQYTLKQSYGKQKNSGLLECESNTTLKPDRSSTTDTTPCECPTTEPANDNTTDSPESDDTPKKHKCDTNKAKPIKDKCKIHKSLLTSSKKLVSYDYISDY